MSTTRRFWIIGTLIMALLGTACGGGAEKATATRVSTAPVATATPRPQPTATAPAVLAERLRVAVASFGSESTDPSMGVFDGVIREVMYDWLLWNNPDGTLAPGVAKQWQISTDGLSWNLTLRDDLRFHNGVPLTSEDVKFSIERVLRTQATTPYAATWRANIDTLEVGSPTILKVNTKRPWPVMIYSASAREGTEGIVASKGYFGQAGEAKFSQEPIGSGPWRFVSHDAGIRFVYASTQQKHPYRSTPSFKTLELLLVSEESTRVAMLKTNQADFIEIGPDSVQDLKANRFSVFTIDNTATGQLISFGWADPRLASSPMRKREVRNALGISYNKQEIIDTILGGLATVPTKSNFVVPGVLGYDPTWKTDPYDPDRAKALLATAGYSNGFSIKIYTYPQSGMPWLPRAAEAVAGYWSKIGVRAETIPSDFGAVAAGFRQRPQPDFLIGNLVVGRQPVQSTGLAGIASQLTSKGVTLVIVDPEMDKLVDEANTTLSEDRRVQVIRQIAVQAHDEWVLYPIATTGALYGVSRSIASWTPVQSAYVGLSLETLKPTR
ncbi:MAG: ABC transporter substrate-binding protein [Chloroflexi bacterium]|nr:ABC transporter substrate-binding protein [Chloroflexota bacterium]